MERPKFKSSHHRNPSFHPPRNTIIPATYLIPQKDHKILLLGRQNTGYCDGEFSLIAGHVEAGESIRQSIVREAIEEAGIQLNPTNLVLAHVLSRTNENGEERADFFFTTNEWEGTIINKEPQKCFALEWHNRENLPQNTINYVRAVIGLINKGITYSEMGWKE